MHSLLAPLFTVDPCVSFWNSTGLCPAVAAPFPIRVFLVLAEVAVAALCFMWVMRNTVKLRNVG